MQDLAVIPRILGALFYWPPESDSVQRLLSSAGEWSQLYSWSDPQAVQTLCSGLISPGNYPFSVLFEGQGTMEAPPWGSVYQDKDNLLMGVSAVQYHQFLLENGLALDSPVNEPDDQFGLMLLAMAALLEQEKFAAATTLLEQHLLPWAYRYLERLQRNSVSDFYARLATLAEMFLRDLQTQADLTPASRKLWF
ncbi:TorD/DmsD family molecular chaperone [Entomohabitans teleogrylli]|uniref:TorD/DmsD family molecular chaperone n=1 Tax=Entomohabitans teleogrylli TaxID=1384589 RepID=UPI00073D63E6|nr:molecular chaperone [Entomohabitans teleogrylli]